MKANYKVYCAVAAILGANASAAAAAEAAAAEATPAEAAPESEALALQEVTVTATRRSETVQNVPITIQALTGDTLQKLNVTTFDDFVKYTPNVSSANLGPGQSSIFMRGLSVGVTGQQGTGTTGPIPNVAVYLDDQSTALPGRNLDIYAADLQRIEVLEGPQGTLFGSGAEAGVLRYITNKPKLNVTEGAVNAGYSYTAHGDPNSNVDATLNLPLIDDKLAIRGVIYSDNRGGYINNVPATFTRSATDLGFAGNGYLIPPNNISINNFNQVAKGINPVTYTGARLSLLFQANDDWDVLLQQSYQNMNAQGVFYQMPYSSQGASLNALGEPLPTGPKLGPLEVTTFEPSYNKDRFESTAITVDGKVGDIKLVYNGSYLVRNIEQQQDYTNYSRGVFGYYYQCTGLSTKTSSGNCYSPGAAWQETERNTHLTQELRASTPDDWRLRGIGGIYWEQFKIYDDTDWTYKTVPTCSATFDTNCFNNVQPPVGQTANNPNERNDNVGFFDDTVRTITQRALFASGDYEIIPKTLILTAGTRYYHFDQQEIGGDTGSFYCKTYSTPTSYFGPCTTATNGPLAPYGTNLNNSPYNKATYHGLRSRANLSWHIDSDILVYYTWSQGFRPGGFNRGSKCVEGGSVYDLATNSCSKSSSQYITPQQYRPDTLINNEIGFKTEFFNHRIQVDGAVYQEDWKNTIVEFFAPQLGFGNLTFVTNGPNYRVRGGELQVNTLVTEGLTIVGSGSYNKSMQVNSPSILANNPANPNFGNALTGVQNVFNASGSPLGNSPLFQGNLRVRYEFPFLAYHAFGQVGGQYYGGSWSTVGTVNNYYLGGWATIDAAVGLSKDNWTVQAFAQNLANRNASVYTNAAQWILTETPLRPRVAGVKFNYKFGP